MNFADKYYRLMIYIGKISLLIHILLNCNFLRQDILLPRRRETTRDKKNLPRKKFINFPRDTQTKAQHFQRWISRDYENVSPYYSSAGNGTKGNIYRHCRSRLATPTYHDWLLSVTDDKKYQFQKYLIIQLLPCVLTIMVGKCRRQPADMLKARSSFITITVLFRALPSSSPSS